ncbi:carbohydrate ABC transporter permease [Paenibacillus sp. J5C_2022]|uniref:carbohydrate ABC transporter permease n=1 Tax=Paenibacillus sp. J5C2022 TaxID=2977129 RepID=UPI0021CED5F8|nr:carbohydrate ABC transporter permease [Paenibacillus sp. J5C2022]MCU6709026.1 carbohydrate ABC transporter permease [Paenibacillus sp. J5C2022]
MVKRLDDKVMDAFVYVILLLVGLSAIFPLLYVVSVSLTPITEMIKHGGYIVIPRSISFDAYRQLLSESELFNAFKVTIWITIAGTSTSLLLTTLTAYPLSRKTLPYRSFFLLVIVFTMLFNGGVIPTYLIVKDTGLLNSVWAMVVPSAIGAFYVLIMKSFFESLPEELFDSGRIDGAKEVRILLQIVLPLSMPVMATVGLFYIVGYWNTFFQAIMYVTDQELQPIQVLLRRILTVSDLTEFNPEANVPTDSTRMAAVIVSSLPVIIVYPFIQKYFTQGMLIGSIKG